LLSSSADISEQKAVEDHLFRSAYYDELTGLPTRRVIEHRANSLLRRDDLRGGSRWRFSTSTISSTSTTITAIRRRRAAGRGRQAARTESARVRHAVADQRRRIPAAAHPIQSEARGGGISSRLTLQRLKAPFFIDGSEIFASTSIGVSLYPEHGRSYDVLRQNADIAMYRVKNDGKGAAAFFDAGMEREALAR
jgi:c-di-GMP phosphodiesterase Gmr